MRTTRGLDRLVFFTDAITAIAITLLILPLSDAVVESAQAGDSPMQFLGDHARGLYAFLLSFAVIARLWSAHHATFEHVGSYDGRLLMMNMVWSATVVFLPLPTEMVAQFHVGVGTTGVYIGTMAVSSLTLSSIVLYLHRHPQLSAEATVPTHMLVGSVATTAAILIALVLGLLVPVINFWGLLLILAASPVQRIVDRRAARRPVDQGTV